MAVSYHRSIGRELWVLDATSDLRIPSFVAVSKKVGGEELIVLGFGAHVDARIAIYRAVAEANQLLPGAESRARWSMANTDATSRWLREATVASEYYLLPSTRYPVVTANTYQWTGSSLGEALSYCLTAVERGGMEAFALDLTRPDVGLCVAKVICPGLRHFWARLGPGRLYEVLFELGRTAKPLAEHELNPIPMFL